MNSILLDLACWVFGLWIFRAAVFYLVQGDQDYGKVPAGMRYVAIILGIVVGTFFLAYAVTAHHWLAAPACALLTFGFTSAFICSTWRVEQINEDRWYRLYDDILSRYPRNEPDVERRHARRRHRTRRNRHCRR